MIVDFLERFLAHVLFRHLTDQQNHRRRVLLRGMHADRGVGGARAPRDHHHAGAPGQAGVGAGHECGAAFVAAGHHVDAGKVMQRVQNAQIAFAGHHKHAVDRVGGQHPDQRVGGGVRCCGCGHVGTPGRKRSRAF